MTSDRQLERALPGILADLGAGPADDYAQLLERTAHTRQRPAWSFPERWLPMDTVARPLRVALPDRRLIAVLSLLLIAALVGVALFAGSRHSLPAPFGVARNGLVAFADRNGAIQLGDPLTGHLTSLTQGPADSRPRFSPDGMRVAYLHDRTAGHSDIVVVGTDGSDPRTITADPLATVGFFEWAPDGRSIVVSSAMNQRLRYDVATAAPPTVLLSDGSGDSGMEWLNQVATLSRPPTGAQIAYLGTSQGSDTLVLRNADGNGRVTLVDDPCCFDILAPVWSNDGSRIGFTAATHDDPDSFYAWVVNADGTNLHRLFDDGDMTHTENGFSWSPDDSQVALQRWFGHGDETVVRPITIVDVASGDTREVGFVSTNGFLSWRWSPDGRSIIAAPDDGTGRIVVIDITTGSWTDTGWQNASQLSWQRLAP